MAGSRGTLDRREVTLTLPSQPAERLREQLRGLFAIYMQESAAHHIGAGSDVKNLYLVGDDTAVIDLTATFADAHPSGIMAETLTVDSILRTDFPSFIEKCFGELNSGTTYLRNWHIEAMAHELERFRTGANKRLIITVPPRSPIA